MCDHDRAAAWLTWRTFPSHPNTARGMDGTAVAALMQERPSIPDRLHHDAVQLGLKFIYLSGGVTRQQVLLCRSWLLLWSFYPILRIFSSLACLYHIEGKRVASSHVRMGYYPQQAKKLKYKYFPRSQDGYSVGLPDIFKPVYLLWLSCCPTLKPKQEGEEEINLKIRLWWFALLVHKTAHHHPHRNPLSLQTHLTVTKFF